MEILLATSNLHKIREFREMFKSLTHIQLVSLHQHPDYIPPEETGSTFKENAILKAKAAATHFNMWAIADDSGIVVPALKGEPGIFSRRYAGPQATDLENCHKLLKAMSNLKDHERLAYYECSLAIASPTGLKKCVEGICEGAISDELKGRHGFGYDPLFVKNGYKKSFGEIDDSDKNRISHRRKALERLLTYLETLKQA